MYVVYDGRLEDFEIWHGNVLKGKEKEKIGQLQPTGNTASCLLFCLCHHDLWIQIYNVAVKSCHHS